ncbi:MAG: DNA repair protein RadC [Proteobacteria bacterium]|nr:DNA repair protein RadC [Pseudomonadota bacterium]
MAKDKDTSYAAGHRERLREKFLQHKLMDYEILELLLTYAIPRRDVKPLARQLMGKFQGAHQILGAPMEELERIDGIKRNTAIFIKAIFEIMLLDYKNYLAKTPIFHEYKMLEDYCKLMLSGKTVEEFHVLYLDADKRLIADETHSSGTSDWAAIYPREILKRGLATNANSVILVHNHPTNAAMFSTEDINATKELYSLLKSVNINLFDHLLVANGLVYSAKNMRLLD